MPRIEAYEMAPKLPPEWERRAIELTHLERALDKLERCDRFGGSVHLSKEEARQVWQYLLLFNPEMILAEAD